MVVFCGLPGLQDKDDSARKSWIQRFSGSLRNYHVRLRKTLNYVLWFAVSAQLQDHLIMEPGQPLCSLSLAVAATGRRVTINSGSQKQVSKNGGGCVLITPLSKGTYSMPNVPTAKLNTTLQGASPLLSKVLVKVASKDGPISS